MSKAIKSLKGRRVLISQPERKESVIELSEADKAHMDAEDMKKWTKLTVYAVGEEVKTLEAGDVVYIGVNAIKGAEALEVDGGIKLMVSEYDIAIVW
jgi:hypothetical protein